MPDYNRRAAVYWWSVVLLGGAVLVLSVLQLVQQPPLTWVQVGAGMAIAMLAGFFPVRIPRSKNSFAAGEIFIFLLLLLLMHGPGAAALAAAGEGAVGALRTSKRVTSRLATPAMAAVVMFSAGSVVDSVLDRAATNAGVLIVATMAFALA